MFNISKSLQEQAQVVVLDTDQVMNKRSLYGTVPLLPLHTGFDPLVRLQKQLLAEGFEHTIIISDTVAEFENWKGISEKNKTKAVAYYVHMLKLLGLGNSNIVLASSFQKKEHYWDLVFRISETVTSRELMKASPQEERKSQNQSLKEPFHILFQIADIVSNNAGLVVGNVSQKRIYDVARKVLRKAGFVAPGELLVDLPKDILGNDLNQSSSATRISYHETEETLTEKIVQVSEENKDIIFDLFIHSVFTFTPQVKILEKRYSEKQFRENWSTLCQVDFEALKRDLVVALHKRFSLYQKHFEENQAIVSWIDFDRVRGISHA